MSSLDPQGSHVPCRPMSMNRWRHFCHSNSHRYRGVEHVAKWIPSLCRTITRYKEAIETTPALCSTIQRTHHALPDGQTTPRQPANRRRSPDLASGHESPSQTSVLIILEKCTEPL
ncbi:hypothetical protein J6590_093492 [Homalodisca vitripennis]|nr:hypothetical protein J6590_093492 [Homalodisca vitripennis]